MTLNEKFEVYWAAARASDSPRVIATRAFLAGAKAQEQLANEAAAEVRKLGYCNQCGKRIDAAANKPDEAITIGGTYLEPTRS